MNVSLFVTSLFFMLLSSGQSFAATRQANHASCATGVAVVEPARPNLFLFEVKPGEAFIIGVGDRNIYKRAFTAQTLPSFNDTARMNIEMNGMMSEAGEGASIAGFLVIKWDDSASIVNQVGQERIRGSIEIRRLGFNVPNLGTYLSQGLNSLRNVAVPEPFSNFVAFTHQVELPPVNTRIAAACDFLNLPTSNGSP